ncbi:DUF2264 domain-containing protein [Mucilaginibacter sp. KACC 22063]|uniref:DUF2264 domain-containing protein n=1 Tax=Mucilaginibacter sp. KACC 22063 TaxID=3025666 RepID=UPI0023673E3D|nr:DUF2264 domain-containing protein [Mucilaginibacter sp. KACC 22063]WDF57421.1 DUF2264 domain-containing protein [Mucilaginibacter sp. KACC 22063]
MIKFPSSLIILLLFFITPVTKGQSTQPLSGRKQWLVLMDKVARPVMENLAHDELKSKMPMQLSSHIDNAQSRASVGYLEAFARTLNGIAPWLQSDGGSADEIALRNQYRKWALQAIANAVNPKSKDYMKWNGGQPLVDASFFAYALIRAPWLWENLNDTVKAQVVDVLKGTRSTVPVYSNWILFSGMIEAFFCKYNLDYDPVRIEYGIREFTEHWYVGDGMYADGMDFHLDYYNSFVIQPYLSTILEEVNAKNKSYTRQAAKQLLIGQRYAVILERLINTDGSFPVIGRSIAYRCGAFHHLANEALKKRLPASLKPAQVRCALFAVINKTLNAPGTFTKDGWLNIGLYGKQPDIAEFYITTGSLYLCDDAFLPLGLPESDEFWTAKNEPWSSVKIWSGQDFPADHALDLH